MSSPKFLSSPGNILPTTQVTLLLLIGVRGGCELSLHHARDLALAWRALFASAEPLS